MVAFKKMWSDVNHLIDQYEASKKINKKNEVFLIGEGENLVFLTKEDFVDFWTSMLLYNRVEKNSINGKNKLLYVYELVKELPYVVENSNVLRLQ
jgi:hypothetical protein